MTRTPPPATPKVVEAGAKVIAKDEEYGEWKFSWRVVVEAPPNAECHTEIIFVDEEDFEVESTFDSSTVPSSGRLVLRGTTLIDESLARTITDTLASVEVEPDDFE